MTTVTKEERRARREKDIRREYWVTFARDDDHLTTEQKNDRLQTYRNLLWSGADWQTIASL